ncbi:NADPH-dependent 7-cyano-7-deazaguanine reductase QueF [Dyella sp. M7H15-1]|uniref:NADPH-dependent 7-cyano-7-deazaguanine reductase QueF n=1 Tax=Dyella sp. M7H15-1 TaxID=2501295 RepID=UPI001004DAA6|nr:NADPH-dependent 7-cyano-7-deazaguanine reductase QueF [Dyella sp. M7H15-1]QAU24801.1 NADPH-dependent 7-cyano-7-deazaguanine reductase QueF [Dyella sp. M7H15-1]
MTAPEYSPLGKHTVYANRYDPSLLFPIPRQTKRDDIDVHQPLPFHGVDIWNAYELSWLDMHGKPTAAVAEFHIPATSPNIIESKSFKLYLNGFAQEPVANAAALSALLQQDLSRAAGAPVMVYIREPRAAKHVFADLEGELIDSLSVKIDDYGPPKADYLHISTASDSVEETLVSDLLRSNCPVTGQPDWGSVQITYRGPAIDREGLLRYLVSFRLHNEFHEQCVERIFVDVMKRCTPEQLSVYARYTRRGGLDINPFRSTGRSLPVNVRGARQ